MSDETITNQSLYNFQNGYQSIYSPVLREQIFEFNSFKQSPTIYNIVHFREKFFDLIGKLKFYKYNIREHEFFGFIKFAFSDICIDSELNFKSYQTYEYLTFELDIQIDISFIKDFMFKTTDDHMFKCIQKHSTKSLIIQFCQHRD